MADEKTVRNAEKKAREGKKSFLSKLALFFKNLPSALARPFKNMARELKKVTWPSRKDLLQYTLIVIVFMVFMGLVIGLLDLGASKLVAAIAG